MTRLILIGLALVSCGGRQPDVYVPAVPLSSSVYSVDDVDAGVRCYVWQAIATDRGGISCVRVTP